MRPAIRLDDSSCPPQKVALLKTVSSRLQGSYTTFRRRQSTVTVLSGERTIRISTRRQPHSFSDSHATVRTHEKGVRNGSLAACRNEASRPGPSAFRPFHVFSRVYRVRWSSRSSPIAPLSTHRTLAGITDPIDIFFFTDDSTDNQYSDRMHANMSTVSVHGARSWRRARNIYIFIS